MLHEKLKFLHVRTFHHGELNSSMIVQKLKIMTGPDLQNMMKNQKVKHVGNHPYYFLEWSDHVQHAMT